MSEPTMKGPAPHRACCGHSEAWHLDMLDGHEQCAGCDCRTATGTVDATPEHDLTPSEVALAKVLAAWEAHRFCEDEGVSAARVIDRITDVLCECGMVDARGPGRRLDPEARALLDRARKAGVV